MFQEIVANAPVGHVGGALTVQVLGKLAYLGITLAIWNFNYSSLHANRIAINEV